MKRTTIMLPVELRRRAADIARRDGLSLSAQIRLWMAQGVQKREDEDRARGELIEAPRETDWDIALTP